MKNACINQNNIVSLQYRNKQTDYTSALDITVKSIRMNNNNYSVYYNNNVEMNKVAEFDTLEEAKAYCVENTKGYDEIGDGDNCYEGRSNNFRYEAYEGDSYVVLDEDNEVSDFKDCVYQTEQYYC